MRTFIYDVYSLPDITDLHSMNFDLSRSLESAGLSHLLSDEEIDRLSLEEKIILFKKQQQVIESLKERGATLMQYQKMKLEKTRDQIKQLEIPDEPPKLSTPSRIYRVQANVEHRNLPSERKISESRRQTVEPRASDRPSRSITSTSTTDTIRRPCWDPIGEGLGELLQKAEVLRRRKR